MFHCAVTCVQRYHMTSTAAAKSLNIGVTVLKGFLRKWGINRWPSRKYNSVKKLIEEVERFNPQATQVEEKQVVLNRLK